MKKDDLELLYRKVSDYFVKNMPAPRSELSYGNTFELLVAVILSAQCTDKRVNLTTPAIFRAYPTAEAMAGADQGEMFALVRSISYPNAKAAHLIEMARALVERHDGQVPKGRAELEALAGVGRKTASVIRSVAFGEGEMAVDTHVFRVANRIGLTTGAKTPLATERQLVKGFSALGDVGVDNLLGTAHHWLILHGRYTCTARKPHCERCGVSGVCRFFKEENHAG